MKSEPIPDNSGPVKVYRFFAQSYHGIFWVSLHLLVSKHPCTKFEGVNENATMLISTQHVCKYITVIVQLAHGECQEIRLDLLSFLGCRWEELC